jgi:hypothetical protein
VLDSVPAWAQFMKLIRNTLAFPFYFVAFVLHLLCAAFTVMAQKIAGDEPETLQRHEMLSVGLVCALAIAAILVWALSRPAPAVDLTRLVPQTPMDFRGARPNFTSEQLVWAKPLIRLTACIFAERAIRHYLDPATVSFAACGDGGKIETTLDDNFIDMTVSGIAHVEKDDRPFKVILQHYPPSTDEDGFIPTDIQINTDKIQISCAR